MEQPISREEQLHKRIQDGTVTDRDLQEIEERGDRSLKKALNEKERHLRKEKEHLDRLYGEGAWDGKDEEGRLFKNIPLGQGII